MRQHFVKFQVRRSGGTVIANVGVIGAFLVIHPLHKLRDDDVHVRVTLAMRVRREIERHVIEIGGEIRAVVEIETAQEVLVGFPAARMLGNNHARHSFHNFSHAQNRARLKLLRPDSPLRGR